MSKFTNADGKYLGSRGIDPRPENYPLTLLILQKQLDDLRSRIANLETKAAPALTKSVFARLLCLCSKEAKT